MSGLGKWTILDIETTGIDPSYDQIIDVGFLQFDGTQLVRSYSSLVRCELPLSNFIQKLTGINESMVRNAPLWNKVEPELLSLEGHHLIAHNANFERSFVDKYFDTCEEKIHYHDSLFFLSLLFPARNSLSLESFIVELKIADSEQHRGLADSVDLLKVMLLGVYLSHSDLEFRHFLSDQLNVFTTQEFWFQHFFNLEQEQLIQIAESIEFDLEKAAATYWKSLRSDDQGQDICEQRLDFNGDNIQRIFRDELKLKKFLPHYQYRMGQEQLALRVGQSFNNNIHSLIQAPTGTGKTIGYLIPSMLYSMNTGEQVLISTGTKTLQNQALAKDVPQAKQMLGLDESKLKVCRLIGSSNHYCESAFRNLDRPSLLRSAEPFEVRFADIYFETVFFVNQKDPLKGICRSDIPYVLKRLNSKISELDEEMAVDYKACTGSNCPFINSCTYMQGLRAAKESNIIVGNHALTLTWPKSFPRPTHIVVDEAHRLESEATSAFTMIVSAHELDAFTKGSKQILGPLYYLLGAQEGNERKVEYLRKESTSLMEVLKDHLLPLADKIELFFKKMPRFTDIYWNEVPMIKREAVNDELSVSIFNHIESLKNIFEQLHALMIPYATQWQINEIKDDKNKVMALTAFEKNLSTVESIVVTLATLLEDDDTYAKSMKYHNDYGHQFECAPIDIGKLIHSNLLENSESVVFTSATLANASGDMGGASVEWMTGYRYLPAQKRFKTGLFLDKVYDYKNAAKVYLCTNVPDIYDHSYVESVLAQLFPLIRHLDGRTLLLFSAKVRFEKAVEILLEKFEGEIPLFVQGMGSNVVEEFKRAQRGILIGMESFGEGIDIPGDSLQLVYIDKIPDLRQDVVVGQRRDFYARQFGNEFNDYFLAHRTRSLHQKLGRLIRTQHDRGGIIITDPRVKRWKKGTLDTFKKLMEPYEINFLPLEQSCEAIQNFISPES